MKVILQPPSRARFAPQSALVGAVMLVLTCLAPCEQKLTDAEQQTVAKIEKRIEEAYDRYSGKLGETEDAYLAKVRKILESLSEDEVRLAAQHVGLEIEREAFRAWARFDATGALKAVRVVEDANADEIKLAGTGLEGGPGEAMQEYVCEMYLGAIEGWAEVAPTVAWESFKERKGSLGNSLVIDDCLSSFYRVLFEHLAKIDPGRAFKELISHRSTDFEEMHVASMFGGYLRGAPRGRDWRKEVNQLLEREWMNDWRVHSEIRTALMGRWLQDDAEAAEEWFHGSDVEGLSWSYRSGGEGVKIRYDLGSAAGYWAARDLPTAWNWVKSYKGFKREGFGGAVLHGADVFLRRSDSYYVGGAGARAFLLEQATKLPDEQDREACVSMIEGAVANTKDVYGVPEKPISEKDGADEPATAPESKQEGGDKTRQGSGERYR